ncbi:MAG: SRPBCC family protein [Nitratireductor sp.]
MIKVRTSTVIDASIDAVWALASDFNGLPAWHPAAAESHIEEGKANNEIGCVRNFALKDGSGRVRETLLAASSVDHTITYDMVGGPLPFVDYVSVLRFEPVTDGDRTFAVWTAEFRAGDGQTDKWGPFVRDDVFLGGLKALERAVKARQG